MDQPDLQEIVHNMAVWDGELGPDSPNAAVYEITIRRAIRMVLDAHLGDFGVRLQGKGVASFLWSNHTWVWFIHLLDTPESPWFDLGHGEQRDDALTRALRQALDELHREQETKKETYRLGKSASPDVPSCAGCPKTAGCGLQPGFLSHRWGRQHDLVFPFSVLCRRCRTPPVPPSASSLT